MKKYLLFPPAFRIVAPFAIGVTCGRCCHIQVFVLLGTISVMAILLMVNSARTRIFFIMTLLAFFLTGWLRYELACTFPVNHISRLATIDGLVGVEGIICGPVRDANNKKQFVLEADSIWIDYVPRAVSGRLRVTVYDSLPHIHYGDRIVLKGMIMEPAGQRNPGGFDYRAYLAARGIHRTLSVRTGASVAVINVKQGNPLMQALVYPVRRAIITRIDSYFTGQQAALLKGLLVGAREDIDDDLYESFANVGVVHVLAVSGLHVGFILGGFIFIGALLRLPSKFKDALVICALFYYVLLTGGNPPVTRAAIMAVILTMGRTFGRNPHAVNTLSLAAFIILLINPLDLFTVGFQLSFSAVCGIVLLYRAFEHWLHSYMITLYENNRKFSLFVIKLFLVSLAAQIATLPLTAWYFGRIPVISLLLNLPVVPLVGFIVGFGYAGLILSLFINPLWNVAFIVANWLLKGLIWLVTIGDKLAFTGLENTSPSLLALLIYTGAILFVLSWPYRLWNKGVLYCTILLVILAVWQPLFSAAKLRVTFLDVGQGDSALIEYPGGDVLLVDAGECTEHFDCGKSVVGPCLRRKGIKYINTLLITHGHSDHAGGAFWLLQNYPVGRLVMAKVEEDEYTTRLDSLAAAVRVPVEYVLAGDTLHCGVGKAVVLHPNETFVNAARGQAGMLNNASIVLKLYWGKQSFLLTGDAEKEAEYYMLCLSSALSANVLKLGHHGSKTATSKAFLGAVSPEYAIVSVGRRNRFGLPSDSLMQALSDMGIEVIRTDVHGAIVFESDGETLQLMGI